MFERLRNQRVRGYDERAASGCGRMETAIPADKAILTFHRLPQSSSASRERNGADPGHDFLTSKQMLRFRLFTPTGWRPPLPIAEKRYGYAIRAQMQYHNLGCAQCRGKHTLVMCATEPSAAADTIYGANRAGCSALPFVRDSCFSEGLNAGSIP